MQKEPESKNFFYPPGGILLWIIIVLEIATFGFALVAFMYNAMQEPELFKESSKLLNVAYGATNTVFLICSGFFMAVAVELFKAGNLKKTSIYMRLAMLGGILFLLLKTVEYAAKIEGGQTMGSNTFFTFYWLLTGFHVIHVLVGLVILGVLHLNLQHTKTPTKTEDLEAGAAFWHMCDLIWLLLFPVLYLLH